MVVYVVEELYLVGGAASSYWKEASGLNTYAHCSWKTKNKNRVSPVGYFPASVAQSYLGKDFRHY